MKRPSRCFHHPPAGELRLAGKAHRSAFTLFELILAIALSVALLALIGTAINLYLLQVDASRSHIEEAQLARSILAMVADDLRATSVYKAQDTSGIASLVAASAKFDVDSVDNQNPGSSGSGGTGGGGGSATGGSSSGGNSSGGSSSGGSLSGGGSSMGGSSAAGGASGAGGSENDLSLPLGINGTVEEMYVDVEHLPRLEELFLTTTGYTNSQQIATAVGAMTAAPPRPNSVKTVRYFVRQGQPVQAGSAAVTSLAPDLQLEAGGLVRQEIARPARVFAEQTGDQTVLDSGQTLIAPEVAHIEFRYFDGTLGQVLDYWDMKEKRSLPPSIEVRIWIWPANADPATTSTSDVTSIMNNCHEYRQIVFVPTSALSTSSAAAGMSGEASGTSGTSTSSSSSSSTGSGSGSSFDN